MRKFYSACTVLFVIACTTAFEAKAQTPMYFSSGTGSSNSFPFATTASNKVQWIYEPIKFSASPISPGNVSKVYIKSSTATTATYSNIRIQLGYTALTAFPAGTNNFITGLTEVYFIASRTITSGIDTWIEFSPVNGTFYYDGVQNLVVEASQTGYTGSGFSVRQDGTGGNLRLYGGVASSTGTAATGLANFGFDLVPAGPCTAPPTPGDALANPDTVCTGASVQLQLVNHSQGTGQTYQWQSATSAAGPWTNVGSSSSFSWTNVNPTATTWYRAEVVCGASTAYSTPVQVLVNPAFPGGTYTIDAGSPTGGTNFQTFNDAINAIACGITGPIVFNVQPGTYNEQVIIPQIGGASAVNTITFKGNLATLSFNSTNSNSRAGITLDGADHVIIDSLVIDGSAGTYGWGIQLRNGADSNTVSNNVIIVSTTNTTSAAHIGIAVGGTNTSPTTASNAGSGNIVTGNTVTGGYYAVTMYGNSAAPYPTGNQLTNNIIKDSYAYLVYVYGNANPVISKNEMTRPVRSTSTTTAGLYISTGVTGALIEKNRIHNLFDAASSSTSTAYGIYVGSDATGSAPNRLFNNLIYNTGGNGIVYGIYNTGADTMLAYHNTVSLDDVTATTGATYGFYQTTAATGIRFINNIVTISRSGTGTKRNLYFVTTTSNITSNNNVLVMGSTGGTANAVGQYGTTTYNTLTDWKTANGSAYDQASVSVDPLYSNPTAGDYKPNEVLLNNIGANVGVTTDILDSTRNVTGPDPGAYEFSGPPCVNPPTPGNAIASVATVCPNSGFTLDLTGNSTGEGQTYQWQASPDGTTWTNTGGVQVSPAFATTQPVTSYYRAAVTCSGGTTVYSTPIQVISPTLVSGNFTIDAGAPSGGGNFQTFTEAVNSLACGINGPVVFTVAAGTYNEQVTIPAIQGTSSVNTIKFRGNLATLSFNSTNTNSRAGITLNGADHIIIDSLVIDGSAGTYGWGIQLMNGADSNLISNCIITVNNTTGTTAYYHLGITIGGTNTTPISSSNAGSYNTITGNTITGGYYPVVLYGNSAAPYPTGNIVSNNIIRDAYSYSVYLYGNRNVTVSKNDISRPMRSVSTTTAGVYLSTGVIGALVEKNRIHNMFDALATSTSTMYGIYVGADAPAGSPNIIANNLIYNIGGNGSAYGIYNSSADSMKAYHNTISIDDQTATTGAAYGVYQTTTSTGIEVKNNIITISRSGTGTKRNVYYATTTSTITSNNNVLLMSSTAGTSNAVGQYGTTTYNTLANWQTANSNAYDQQSVSVDPLYINPAAGNYMPNSSLVNNIGTPVGITTDIQDSARSGTAPDPGAYEFSNLTAGINMMAEALLSPVNSATGCYTGTETVSVRIRNTSTSAIDFASNPVTVTVNVTGAVTQNLVYTVNTGTLQSDSVLEVAMPAPLDMTTPGVYTFTASTSVAGDANTANDTAPVVNRTKVALTSGTVSGPPAYCVTSPVNPTLTSSGYNGQTFLQWVSSTTSTGGYTPISGGTTVPYTVTTAPTQTMYYRLVVGCGTATDSSAVHTVTYNDPQVTGSTPGSRCGTGTVTLAATGSAGTTLEWFAAASGGTALGTGTSFTTPSISSTTTYYVAASLGGGGLQYVGAPNTGIGSASVVAGYYMVFTVNAPLTIQSVNAYFNTMGAPFTLNIRNAPGGSSVFTYSGTVSVTGTSTPQVIPINATLAPGTYEMGWTTDPGTYRNSTGASYPYTIPGVISITGNTFNNAAYYYYFYNWAVLTGCASNRTAVTATVNPTASNAAGAAGTTECATVSVSGTGTTEFNYTDCDAIAAITPSGASPVSGNVDACVTIDNSVLAANGQYYVPRHYDITPATNAATATATVRVYFLQSEFTAYNTAVAASSYPTLPTGPSDVTGIANLRITQFHGTGTNPLNYTGAAEVIDPADANIVWDAANSRWQVTINVTGFSGFYVHTGNFVLPVTITDFKGEMAGAMNKLMWTTATEKNNKGFELQRSADGKTFTRLAFLSSRAADGTSTTPLSYSFDDSRPFEGSTFYRLKQVDNDGKIQYSNVVVLTRKAQVITLSAVYPNPT
ncbi:MAG TPA: right-handed parallel beta-helix repeat-containing protein, partial [Chitinophagaceae bacterium]